MIIQKNLQVIALIMNLILLIFIVQNATRIYAKFVNAVVCCFGFTLWVGLAT